VFVVFSFVCKICFFAIVFFRRFLCGLLTRLDVLIILNGLIVLNNATLTDARFNQKELFCNVKIQLG
jgi:hypothetical protein